MAVSVPPTPSAPPHVSDDKGKTPVQPESELLAKVARLIAKNNGDASAAVDEVLTDNKKLRDRHREDSDDLAKVRQQVQQVPQGGAIVTAEQKALLDKLTELKIDKPDVLVTLTTEHATFKADKAKADKSTLIADMATGKDDKGQDIGYDAKLLGELLELKGMDGEFKDAIIPDPTDKAKTISIKIPYVKPRSNPNAAAEPLTQYVTRELSGFQDALRKVAAPANQSGQRGRTQTPQPKPVPQQPTSTPSQSGQVAPDGNLGVAQRVLGSRYGDPFAKPGDKSTS